MTPARQPEPSPAVPPQPPPMLQPTAPPEPMPLPPVMAEPVAPAPQPAMVPPPAASLPPPEPVRMPAPLPIDGIGIRARFGSPDFVRRDMATELWRYDLQNCAVFFFMQRNGPGLRVQYTETLPRGMNMTTDTECLLALERRSEATPPNVMGLPGPQP